MIEDNNIGKGIVQAIRGVYEYGGMDPMTEEELVAEYAALGFTPKKSGLAPDSSEVDVRARLVENPIGLPSDQK